MQRTSSGVHPSTPTTRRPVVKAASGVGPPGVVSPRRSGSAMVSPGSPRRTTSGVAGSQLAQSMAQSMTIDEMRLLHQRAVKDAEAKRTELRLVLASRYRELVGSSDEVIKMKERAQELHELVHNLPILMVKLQTTTTITDVEEESKDGKDIVVEKDNDQSITTTAEIRRKLSFLPRIIYRALDGKDVHKATVSLIQLFTLIASQTDAYPAANALSSGPKYINDNNNMDPALEAQMRMIFLQMQTLPDKIRRIANGILAKAASYGKIVDPILGAERSAAAISSLHFLDIDKKSNQSEKLLNIYFEAKAKLLVKLLSKLKSDNNDDNVDNISSSDNNNNNNNTQNAEEILSKIVLILQHDIIMHPYQIFVIRKFPTTTTQDGNDNDIMTTLPLFDKEIVKVKCSKFLASHLPLIRTKVKSVLVSIAGTTASALGQIRQSLYDKTDGIASMERLNENGICTWDEAVFSMIESRTVVNSADAEASQHSRFSLWGALFSNTFSSLVHSLLTTAFQSVHTKVISTLRDSLTNAPPVTSILPHEAYRNTLKIATDLNESLLKVSADAHELLVHAEEREESERRLRQSLYVQTCEILGRLICELRRMAFRSGDGTSDAAKELIIGRLCFLLKFRLTSLRSLLSPDSSPSSMVTTGGMISYIDLNSAFELADHDEDGLVSFQEAMEAVESAFSGTQFQGSSMVKDTLMLSSEGKQPNSTLPTTVTLSELILLTARGLRHDKTGPQSALGTVQLSLDNIIKECFQGWAKSSLSFSVSDFESSVQDFIVTASSVSEEEWLRIFSPSGDKCKSVSPHVVSFMLDVASTLNRNTCPSDTLSPVPSNEYASTLGIQIQEGKTISTMMDTIRYALLSESITLISSVLEEAVTSEVGANLDRSGASALIQLHVDVLFIRSCFLDRSFIVKDEQNSNAAKHLETVMTYIDQLLKKVCDGATLSSLDTLTAEKHKSVLEASDLFFSSLFGDDTTTSVSPAGEVMSSAETAVPTFHLPLSSSRRFALLPVQADRSLSDIQIKGKLAKEKEEEEMERRDTLSGNVISGGFGFLSNMLKTGKK